MATLEDLSPEERDSLALLARELSNGPNRKDFLALAKKVRPDMPTPELDLDARIVAIQNEANERVAKVEGQLAERDQRAELQRRRDALIASGKAKDAAEIELIEKIMLEKNIANHETAADYHKWMSQAAAPTPPSYNMNFMDQGTRTQLKDFWKNPKRAARDEAARALDDLRRNPRLAG